MFILGMLIIVSTLIYLLVTSNERGALYIFGVSSLAYFIFGYGVPLNEINMLVGEANIGQLILQFITIMTVIYLVNKFEDTVFLNDYNLILRSFFFRFETMTLALYLLGILISSGHILTDLLVLVTLLRLFKVDRFIGYVVVNSVLFTNAIFIYPANNVELLDSTVSSSNLMHTSSMLVAIIIPVFMLVLYSAGFLVRNLEKDIVVEFKFLAIIAITTVVGLLGVESFSSRQLLVLLPILALVLLYLNDMNVRKKFSRYSQIPITLSVLLLLAFIATLYIGEYSFILFMTCAIIINSIVLNERYQVVDQMFVENPDEQKTLITAVILILLMTIFANFSVYNATEIGVPYIQTAINEVVVGQSNVLGRTFELYTNAAYFTTYTPQLISSSIDLSNAQFLIIAIPALSIIAVPTQILIMTAIGYKTKISGEILMGSIAFGLLVLTLVSYAIGA